MFRFLCKIRLQNLYKAEPSLNRHHFLQTQSLKSSPNISNSTIHHSPTVSYLVNSCGLSLDSAISASKKVQIENPKKPDSVLQLFKTYGFTKTQTTDLITKYPQFLACNADKTLKPKFEFYESLGFSKPDLAKLIVINKSLLLVSLGQRIIPNVNYLKTFLHTNKNIVAVVKRSYYLIYYNLHIHIEPKRAVLRAHGVPDSNVSRLLLMQPRIFTLSVDLLQEAIRVVEEMGFSPDSTSYILAIRSVLGLSKWHLEKKIEVFTSFGWSKEDFLSAFKLQPICMQSSENKIRILMDFFVNKLGVKPSDLAKCPNIFLMSLEKRIIPRCSVLQILFSKGLIDKNSGKIIWVLNSNSKTFVKKFVAKYQDKAPEVLKAYKGELGCSSFETLRSFLR